LAELGGSVEFGTMLVDFTQSDESVAATLDSGGSRATVTASWLVGSDGGHSVVRKQSGITFEGETRDELRMIVADLAVDGLDRDAWHMWRHAEGAVSLCPLPSTDIFQYQGSILPGQDADLSLANLQSILEQRTGRTDIRLHEPEWSTLWRANIRLADRYRVGRVFLAGDAAHIHPPAGGQGMNTGIQDAHNLGWKLAAVVNGASPTLLDTYEAERRPVAAGVLELSNARLADTVANKGMSTQRDASTIQLNVGYRGSSLARDDRDETAMLRAGDRAPDATGLVTADGERRLFDLTRGGRFTLLSFGNAPTIAADASQIRTFSVVAAGEAAKLATNRLDVADVVDSEGTLARTYDATDNTLVLIRPDGYIGVISDSGETAAVSDYLDAMR
jgi:hypothetical protein